MEEQTVFDGIPAGVHLGGRPGHDQLSDCVGVIHFVGIGGVGMSGIAEVLLNLGCRVQGSDMHKSPAVERLGGIGARVFISHRPEHVRGCDVVVVSSAISPDNPEVRRARELGIPVIKRAEMLAELMRFRFGVAVAGTHGKTTTTSLTAAILSKAGLDPTFVVGGRVNSYGTNARLGASAYLVTEADESDASFLHLQPMMAIVTNIDDDHLVAYGGSFDELKRSFVSFIHNLPFYGTAVVCNEDATVRELSPQFERQLLSYGFGGDSGIVAERIRFEDLRSCFRVRIPDRDLSFEVQLNLPGRHNVLNALAAIGIACKLGIAPEVMQETLAGFEGIGRRFQSHGEIPVAHGRVLLIDDYGHHPTEVRAVLDAASEAWPQRRKVLVFQPHRYTRTSDLFEDFCEVLGIADELVLLDVYPANEAPIKGADSHSLCRSIRSRGRVMPVYVRNTGELPTVLDTLLRDGDLLVTMGAGSVGGLAEKLAAGFRERSRRVEGVL